MLMKKYILPVSVLFLLILWLFCSCNEAKTKPSVTNFNTGEMQSIYDIKLVTLDGKETTLVPYKGKKILIVNTASECGYTPQYADLQKLHETHGAKLVVLGFPSNDFGGQEPGTEKEIGAFCQKNYGVTFQMFSKVHTTGENQHPLYRWLSSKELNGWNSEVPGWNFCKYLISEDGKLLKFFHQKVKPLDEEIISLL